LNVEGIPWLGVSFTIIRPELAEFFSLKDVKIEGIIEGGLAEEAGLKRGDIIYSVNGKKVNTPQELQALILYMQIGDKVEVKIIRDGKEISYIVKIGKKP